MKFKIKLADLLIGVACQYDYLKKYCGEYIADETNFQKNTSYEDFQIEIGTEDTLFEQQKADSERASNNISEKSAYLETLAALRKIAEIMPEYHRILMHGVVVSWRGSGYLFTAPSGTGKSTHAALWKKYFGDDVEIINGDKPFLNIFGSECGHTQVYAYGTPWSGKERWQKNTSVPLKGICILQRGKINCIRQLPPAEALPWILRQVHFPQSPVNTGKTLELIDRLLESVPVYQLECDISEEAVRCSFEGMTGKRYLT